MSNTFETRGVQYVIGVLLAFSTTAGFASEPLTYYGFDKESRRAGR